MLKGAADRSTLPLSEAARHVVIPEGIVDTLWFEVEERCQEFGDTFDVWQDGLGQVTLGLRSDGMFAASIGGVTYSIPRQVAKTFIVGRICVALCTLFPELTVLWTAHRTRTATNTFQKLKGYVLRPAVKHHLKLGGNQGTAIRDANGEQEIPFANGSRIMFGAREQGFGRGFDEVDIEVFDEAQILTEKALEDMIAATNQSRFQHGALLFYMGTPPRPVDPGEAFTSRRADALEKKAGVGDFSEPVAVGDAVYVECSGDPDVGRDGGPSLDDVRQVEKANPSFPHRTPPIAVKRLRKNLPSDSGWRREGLGVWDVITGASAEVRRAEWDALAVEAAPTGAASFGVKFSPDGRRAAVAAAVLGADGAVTVEALHVVATESGMDEVKGWLVERARSMVGVGVDGRSDAAAFTADLMRLKVPARKVAALTTGQAIEANAAALGRVRSGTLHHTQQPELTASVLSSGKRKIGNAGGWGWIPLGVGDALPWEAACIAAWVAGNNGTRPRKRPTSSGKAVFV